MEAGRNPIFGQKRLSEPWWQHCSAIMRFSPKVQGTTLRDVTARLDEVKETWGIDAVEVFAPYYGGIQYDGLDAMDYYTIDPAIGNMDDFLVLVRACHERGLAIIIFTNLGYGAMEFSSFLRACDDVRAGVDSREARWFLWSDRGTEKFDKSRAPHFMNDVHGHWHYSERAGKYYWVKWRGQKDDVELPQFNFGDPGWQEECRRVVEFWLKTGIDGMIIDAVNWYMNCTWEINNETMTDVIHRHPNQYIQPEGAGGFADDPVLWISEGHYNSVQDYGLAIWWTDHDVVGKAIATGDPSPVEEALRAYRDRVVAAGGVTYIGPYWAKDLTYEQRFLEAATIATVGEIFHARDRMLDLDWPKEPLLRFQALLKAVQAYPALQAAGDRKKLPTADDHKYYAFLRTAADGAQQVLVVLNFQKEEREVMVQLDKAVGLTDVFSLRRTGPDTRVRVTLPPYGYGIYLLGE